VKERGIYIRGASPLLAGYTPFGVEGIMAMGQAEDEARAVWVGMDNNRGEWELIFTLPPLPLSNQVLPVKPINQLIGEGDLYKRGFAPLGRLHLFWR
jgi:hypothetical protein